ncbi:MAG: hypothetical protein IKV98_06925 [Clostridia bacterium]|nr:hypothetical protein [Clostridia bacterium]
MRFSALREELKAYYQTGKADESSRNFYQKCMAEIDKRAEGETNPYQTKMITYRTITEMFEPVVFANTPFYHETGTICALSDGSRMYHGNYHAGGWTFFKNQHLFMDQDPDLWRLREKQGYEELFYLICGPYNDVHQHFSINCRPFLEIGLSGVCDKAKLALETAETDEEKDFLNAVVTGMLCLKRMCEKFSEKAESLLENAKNDEERKNLSLLASTAKRVPWEAPKNFYEALATLCFIRRGLGALEGVGPNTFGRIDMDLYPFYKKDIEEGTMTKDEAFDLICDFLINWDCHYDHDMKMVGYADHELENTYTIGGCDKDGNPLCNDLTLMFLRATREEKIIFPKIKCRYSKNSPKEYLDEMNKAIIAGTSTVLIQNDDATIPALINAGRTLDEARDYLVSGCWGVTTQAVEKHDHGSYMNLLRPFEYGIYKLYDKMDDLKMHFKTFDECKDFEEVYQNVVYNSEVLFRERLRVSSLGGQIRNKVDPWPIFSSTLCDCIEKKKDFSAGGAKYNDDFLLCVGLPNIVDSLVAIKKLCFDTKKYTLVEFLDAVRANWEGHEDMRLEAINCPGWGDGSAESCELANRFNNDLYEMCTRLTGTYGGKVHLGHLTYTEIRWWAEKTRATPDGRRNGEYFSQGLTPSRLKKIPSVTSVIESLACLDPKTLGSNSVVNIILPSDKITLDICEAFLRACAGTAMQSLQLNCTTKEQLLDAQIHPEKYPDLIVRVCGFSAKFTSLSPEWQAEVISRNFYE